MATTKVTSSVIGDNEVKTVNILNANVTADKIASNAVTTVKINNAAVTADKLGAGAVTAVKLGAGIVTRAYAEDTTRKLATTLMVADDTIPQKTEGDEILTVQDTTANALAAVTTSTGGDDDLNHLTLEHEMASGSTGSTTFKLRIGPVSSANVRTNGISTGRLLGGVMKTTLTVEEIL